MLSVLKYFLFKKRRQKYIDSMYEMEDPWSARTSEPRLAVYLQQLRQDSLYSHVLDVGCGEGLFSRALSEISEKYTGIDISKTALERAQKKHSEIKNINFLEIDFDRLSSLTEKFDLVVFNFVLDYLGFQKHPKVFAQNLYLMLQELTLPEATLVLMNPIYEEAEFEKLNQYIYLFNNFGFQVVNKNIIQENTFKIACVTLKSKPKTK